MRIERGSDITKNVKIIEWIKNEILMNVSDLFNLLFKGVKSIDDSLQNSIANIIMLSYLLGKRLGINFEDIDYKIKEKTKQGIKDEHSIETWFGDLSSLEKHIDNRE
ncbi:MazG-like family protein [Terrisporobacter sp.]|uniref:MazG-like family protein n=1 Tax=Terrisporobacter sp. TaxID=1965305 RepID=UPI002613CCAA|nr:MazG-like family protein [Terrisporobacter sp.]